MIGYSGLPVLQECMDSYPDRPQIDVAATPWTRSELEAKIDYYMQLLWQADRRFTSEL